MRRSPGYAKYLEHDATLTPIPPIGWDLPIQFTTVKDEVEMVRKTAGFIDYSFDNMMAVMGREAHGFLQKNPCQRPK